MVQALSRIETSGGLSIKLRSSLTGNENGIIDGDRGGLDIHNNGGEDEAVSVATSGREG